VCFDRVCARWALPVGAVLVSMLHNSISSCEVLLPLSDANLPCRPVVWMSGRRWAQMNARSCSRRTSRAGCHGCQTTPDERRRWGCVHRRAGGQSQRENGPSALNCRGSAARCQGNQAPRPGARCSPTLSPECHRPCQLNATHAGSPPNRRLTDWAMFSPSGIGSTGLSAFRRQGPNSFSGHERVGPAALGSGSGCLLGPAGGHLVRLAISGTGALRVQSGSSHSIPAERRRPVDL
jgi:hypothetical protein